MAERTLESPMAPPFCTRRWMTSAKGQHAHQFAVIHHHQGAEVHVGHGVDGVGQRVVGPNGDEGASFDPKDVADFHDLSCSLQYSPQ